MSHKLFKSGYKLFKFSTLILSLITPSSIFLGIALDKANLLSNVGEGIRNHGSWIFKSGYKLFKFSASIFSLITPSGIFLGIVLDKANLLSNVGDIHVTTMEIMSLELKLGYKLFKKKC